MPSIMSVVLAVWVVMGADAPTRGQEALTYCRAVQNRVGFIRYPLGTTGVSSKQTGELADAMTLVPRIYPCVETVVIRPEKEDWRDQITGDPACLTVTYRGDKPCGASTAAITVLPHVSVFKVTFPSASDRRYLVLDFSKYRVDSWAKLNKWSERRVTRIDERTLQASVGEPGRAQAYYTIQFSAPCVQTGTFTADGSVTWDTEQVTGTLVGMAARFDAPTVTVAVAQSFTSMAQSAALLEAEFKGFDAAHRDCRDAWNHTLRRMEITGSDNGKRMAYSALYSILVNVIDGAEGSCYRPFTPRPRSLASSVYWQFIGGFQSCCWDNFRTAYPFLMLGYPDLMSDILNTYLARYQRNGSVNGNICLFTGPTGAHRNIRFSPVLVAQALENGIATDYEALYAALKNNFDDPNLLPASFAGLGYVTQPAGGGKACSETLEWCVGAHCLALLAKAQQDTDGMRKYQGLSLNYRNLWDAENRVFRVKDAVGDWGVIDNKTWTWNPNPQGLFEGSNLDWSFFVPHDPFGLIGLPGQDDLAPRITDYCLNDTWFNDFQYHYPYILYYLDQAHEAQRVLRNVWMPLFKDSVFYEGVKPKPPHNGWNTHYTSNAAWLLCCQVGLYPLPAPAGQYLITSPGIDQAVIHHGERRITVRAHHNTGDNIYIRSIHVDGQIYPAYMIPAHRLLQGITIDLELDADPHEGLGPLYIAATDGFIEQARLVSETHLVCRVRAALTHATTRIHCRTRPAEVTLNGRPFTTWTYDKAQNNLTIQTASTADMEVFLSESLAMK